MAELGEFVKHYDELKALDVLVLGVSVDPPEINRGIELNLRTPFPLLSDTQHEAMQAFGTRRPTRSPDEPVINTPTLVLIDRTRTIRWIHQAEDYRVRAPISEVIDEARKLESDRIATPLVQRPKR
jgi:peroxiredoxin